MKKKRWLLILLLLFIGVGLITFPKTVRVYYDLKNKRSYETYKKSVNHMNTEVAKEKTNKIKHCYEKSIKSEEGITDPFNSNKESMTKLTSCLEMGKNDVFSMLEIPKLGLIVPIYLNTSDDALNNGVGLVEGSSLPIGGLSTHTVLAGHRGLWTQEMLRYVDRLDNGDVFYIHTLEETLTYRVFTKTIIYPYETEVLDVEQGKDLATLITCHPFPTDLQRLLIRGERVY